MARWRLTAKHYLNTPGEQWMYEETDQNTGKRARKLFDVPRFLDPDAPSDQNYPGEIIVCQGRGLDRDIPFTGDPTPDMEALDDEARAISARFSGKWVHPIDSLPGDYSSSILNDLQRQIDAVSGKVPAPPASPISAGMVSKEDFDALQAQVAALMAKNAELEEARPKRRI